MIYVIRARELSYMAVSTTASTFRARKDLLPQGSGTLQGQPVGGLQELTHDGIAGSLNSVGRDRFEPSRPLSQAIEVGTLRFQADPWLFGPLTEPRTHGTRYLPFECWCIFAGAKVGKDDGWGCC